MSLLPQRKKSAEEITKLRETFGLPGMATSVVTTENESISEIETTDGSAEICAFQTQVQPLAPPPKAAEVDLSSAFIASTHSSRPVRSLRKSQALPQNALSKEVRLAGESSPLPEITPQAEPKRVRSLRKSEEGPLSATRIHFQNAHSKLPNHRHSDEELEHLRRQTATQGQLGAIPLAARAAHFGLVILGYLSAVVGAICYYFFDLFIAIPITLVGVALFLSGYIFFKKPASSYHAAFIFALAVIVIIFGVLHYFPHLLHAS